MNSFVMDHVYKTFNHFMKTCLVEFNKIHVQFLNAGRTVNKNESSEKDKVSNYLRHTEWDKTVTYYFKAELLIH